MRAMIVVLFCGLFASCSWQSAPPTVSYQQPEQNAGIEANKRTAVEFFELIFNKKRLDLAFERCIGPTYRQHNPEVADGREGLAAFVNELYKAYPDFSVEVRRVVAEGDLVVLHVLAKRTVDDTGTVSMDMFRFENGRIVEHWDVVQGVPTKAKNPNGMI